VPCRLLQQASLACAGFLGGQISKLLGDVGQLLLEVAVALFECSAPVRPRGFLMPVPSAATALAITF
jgi:hypothetical protein